MSKRLGSPYISGRSAVKREAEEDWGRDRVKQAKIDGLCAAIARGGGVVCEQLTRNQCLHARGFNLVDMHENIRTPAIGQSVKAVGATLLPQSLSRHSLGVVAGTEPLATDQIALHVYYDMKQRRFQIFEGDFVSTDSDQTKTAPRKFKLGPLGSLNQVTKGLAKTIRAMAKQNASH